jgi:hypothetical protein
VSNAGNDCAKDIRQLAAPRARSGRFVERSMNIEARWRPHCHELSLEVWKLDPD